MDDKLSRGQGLDGVEIFSFREKDTAQMGYFVYCFLPAEKTIVAEPRLEAA